MPREPPQVAALVGAQSAAHQDDALDLLERSPRRECFQRAPRDPVQDPHVVQSGDVVGMRVGEQDGIGPGNAATQELKSLDRFLKPVVKYVI